MAEPTRQQEKSRETSSGITDGAYIPRSEAPNMPRVFINADPEEKKDPERRSVPLGAAALGCMACLVLGIFIGSRAEEKSLPAQPEPTRMPLGVLAAYPEKKRPERSAEAPVSRGGTLNITVQTVNTAAAAYFDICCDGEMVEGAQVFSVTKGSSAESAGLIGGDIITAVDGEEIVSAEELRLLLGRRSPGEETQLRVFRDGKMLDLPAVLEGEQSF